jgi:hypothetical protein
MKARSSVVLVLAAALPLAVAPLTSAASVIGFLGNFDVINDTGKTAHGFEIDLEGLHSSDISDVFGGPGRGFPTGRGFDPSTSVERYGAPTITEYLIGSRFGTKITYHGIFDGSSWDFGTPSGTFVTPGDNCWSGGGIGYGPSTPCDHFGVGTIGNPTKTTYSWLLETATPGVLTNGLVNLPAPAWTVIPAPPVPVGNPPAPPQVVAHVEAPDPLGALEFGDALWVKVFTTEFEDPLDLEELVGNNARVRQAETEIEWQLLQKEVGNPLSGLLESGLGAPVGPNAASILRRYEFFKYSGEYDPETHEALFAPGFGDSRPNPLTDIGNYLGAQNAAANLAAAGIPEPGTLLLLGSAVATLLLRRQRQ